MTPCAERKNRTMDRSRIERVTLQSRHTGRSGKSAHTLRKARRRPGSRPARHARRASLKAPGLAPGLRLVDFAFFDLQAAAVGVAGTFNNWSPLASPLRNLGAGRWGLQLPLAPGQYEYRFLVDGQWRRDPLARMQVTDFCGGTNSVLVVE